MNQCFSREFTIYTFLILIFTTNDPLNYRNGKVLSKRFMLSKTF